VVVNEKLRVLANQDTDSGRFSLIKERRLVRLVVQRTNSGISLETLMRKDRVKGGRLILQPQREVKVL